MYIGGRFPLQPLYGSATASTHPLEGLVGRYTGNRMFPAVEFTVWVGLQRFAQAGDTALAEIVEYRASGVAVVGPVKRVGADEDGLRSQLASQERLVGIGLGTVVGDLVDRHLEAVSVEVRELPQRTVLGFVHNN